MIAVAVVPSFRAFSLTDCHNSASMRIDLSGVIEPRTHSLNPNTSQETQRWVHQCQPTKGLQQPAKPQLSQLQLQLLVHACHAL
jgi:hypothetical protein